MKSSISDMVRATTTIAAAVEASAIFRLNDIVVYPLPAYVDLIKMIQISILYSLTISYYLHYHNLNRSSIACL